MNVKTPCPCNAEVFYADCCQPLHDAHRVAETPEQLMRSRYSAFALKLAPYLLATWHPQTRPAELNLDDQPQWIKLQILRSDQRGDRGFVHFRAFYKERGEVGFMEEKSTFTREHEQWLYLSGDVN